MKLPDVRFNIDPKTGAWIPVTPEDARAPYVRFERRPIAVGESYRVVKGGIATGESKLFPAGQTQKIVMILRHLDGSEDEALHYGGADFLPVDQLPGVENV